MFIVISAYMRRLGKRSLSYLYILANGIKADNQELIRQGLWGIGFMLVGRILTLFALGFIITFFWWDWDTYWGYVILIYAFLIAVGCIVSDEIPNQEVPPVPTTEVAVELARQRGVELQKYMLAFLYRIIVATRSATDAQPPNDEKGVWVSSPDGQSFYMSGEVVIFQGEVQIDGDITSDVEDTMQKELQEAVPKYIDEFPELIDPNVKGRPPVEILTIRGVGRKVIIDAVITTEKSIPLIEARRQARVERQKRQERQGQADDPLFR